MQSGGEPSFSVCACSDTLLFKGNQCEIIHIMLVCMKLKLPNNIFTF